MVLRDEIKPITRLSRDYRNFVESFFFVLDSSVVDETPIQGRLEDVYRGDFFGLLEAMKIESRFWGIVATVNRVSSTGSYKGNLGSIKIPDKKVMERINKLYITKVAT